MRVLFTFAGGAGHADPMVPIARALAAAGHTVAFTGSAKQLTRLQARGFESIPLSGPGDSGGAVLSEPTTWLQALIEPNQAHEDNVIRRVYAGTAARRRAPLYLEIFRSWRPDLVVRDEMDFGSAIIAEALGLPHAVVIVIAAGGFIRPDVVADSLDELRAEYGLPADPELVALGHDLVLSPFPPRLRDPAFPLPSSTQHFGPGPAVAPTEAGPSWLSQLDDRPVVYLTLGTVFPLESGDLFLRLLAGLAELPVSVITTIGRDLDPAALGAQPANVHIEHWLPHDLVLPLANLVVSHGGSGTVTAALTHGLPQIVVAMGADQMLNARRVEVLGLGASLHPITSTPAEVRDTAAALLDDAGTAAAATAMQRAIADLPRPESLVATLELLVRGAAPPTTARMQA